MVSLRLKPSAAFVKHTGSFLKPQGAGAQYHDAYLATLVAMADEVRNKIRTDVEHRFNRVLALLDECFGPPLPNDLRTQVLSDAPDRYVRQQPPGYSDAGKAARGEAAYFDVLVFFEMMRVARLRNADVAFITNDSKEDWWEIDATISPRRLLHGRRELSLEFRKETGRQFAVFHGLRLVSDINGLTFLSGALPTFIGEWERQVALSTASGLDRLFETFSGQLHWSHFLLNPRAIDAISGSKAMLDRVLLGENRLGFDFERLLTGSLDLQNFLDPIHPSISKIAGLSDLPLSGITSGLDLDKLSGAIDAFWRPAHLDIFNSFKPPAHFDLFQSLGMSSSHPLRLLQDMTFDVSRFTSPYLEHMQAILDGARAFPRVDPTVKMLDVLSRVETPERRRDAAAMRRRHTKRRRSLRRKLRGRRINLLNPNLPLRRVLVAADSD